MVGRDGPHPARPCRTATPPVPVLAALLASLLTAPLLGPCARAGQEAAARPRIETLRQDEDWSALCRPGSGPGALEAIKCLPLTAGGEAWLSLGGTIRERYEYTHNPLWGAAAQDPSGTVLQRYVLHGDLHLGPRLRLFGQLSSALASGRAGPPSPVDEDRTALQQGFVDLAAPLDGVAASLRLGRQELRYGSARLVDVREGPNVRRAFDGGRSRLDLPGWRVDAIAVRPVRQKPGNFDDRSNGDQALWGLYAVGAQPAWLPFGSSIDLYYLGYDNEAGRFEQGIARERRHSLGSRIWGSRAGWDWNWEAIGQAGSFGDGAIRAWSLATDTGYRWPVLPWAPRVGLSANIASGDADPASPELGTFNPLFPRGNYFSELALLGPRNFVNLHPSLTLAPTERLSLTVDVDLFWRLQRQDGIYSPGGALLRASQGHDARHVGTELSFNAGWQLAPTISLTGIYAHFFPGAFLAQSGPAESIDFFEATLKIDF